MGTTSLTYHTVTRTMQTNLRLSVLILLQIAGMTAVTAQQRITIQINKQTDQGSEMYDTTFVAPDGFDLDSWLEATRLQQTNPGESVSTTIIIHDPEDHRARADVFRPEPEAPREPGMMGVYLDDSPHQTRGVPVKSVIEGGAAYTSGLQHGDTIIEMNGNPVEEFDDLVREKKGMYAGDELPIRYRRGEEVLSTTLTLTGRKPMVEEEEKVETHSPKAYLGVYTEDLTRRIAEELDLEDLRGVLLSDIVDGTPADIAGLESEDVIIMMNGREIQAAWELSEVLRELAPGDDLVIGYIRDGEEEETKAVVGERSSPTPIVEERPRRMLIEETGAFLGVMLQTDSDAPGVPVLGVDRHSAAEEAGLQEGDLIMRIGGQRTENYDSLSVVMRRLTPGEEVPIIYLRDERRRRTTAVLGNRTNTRWILVDPEQNLDPAAIVEEVRTQDRRTGEQLARHMKAPSLEMDFFEFYPNPNQGIFTLNFELEEPGDVMIRVYDPQGGLVYLQEIEDFEGDYRREIDLGQGLTKGLYLIQVIQGSEGMVAKMIVKP